MLLAIANQESAYTTALTLLNHAPTIGVAPVAQDNEKNVEKKLSEALIRVGCLEGASSFKGEEDIYISGGHLDDYLLTTYLGQMLERGEMEIKIAPSRMEYLLKLLHMDNGE